MGFPKGWVCPALIGPLGNDGHPIPVVSVPGERRHFRLKLARFAAGESHFSVDSEPTFAVTSITNNGGNLGNLTNRAILGGLFSLSILPCSIITDAGGESLGSLLIWPVPFFDLPPMTATMTKSPTGLSWDVEPGTKCVHCLLLACRGRSRLLFRWARLLENWSPESCCQPTASQPSTASRPCWQCWLVILSALAFYFCASVRSALVISATLWGFSWGKQGLLGTVRPKDAIAVMMGSIWHFETCQWTDQLLQLHCKCTTGTRRWPSDVISLGELK